jgi:hypothetical protein
MYLNYTILETDWRCVINIISNFIKIKTIYHENYFT